MSKQEIIAKLLASSNLGDLGAAMLKAAKTEAANSGVKR